MAERLRSTPDVRSLARLFYQDASDLGKWQAIEPAEMPSPYRELLHHENHMTVTVERHHACPVDVKVLDTVIDGHHYARKILLARQSDGRIVQFGIMRLNFNFVSDEIRSEVESQRAPLGRILIKHQALRDIHSIKLWQFQPGPDLQELLVVDAAAVIYGRTAMIDVNGEPAVELLEIVAPDPASDD